MFLISALTLISADPSFPHIADRNSQSTQEYTHGTDASNYNEAQLSGNGWHTCEQTHHDDGAAMGCTATAVAWEDKATYEAEGSEYAVTSPKAIPHTQLSADHDNYAKAVPSGETFDHSGYQVTGSGNQFRIRTTHLAFGTGASADDVEHICAVVKEPTSGNGHHKSDPELRNQDYRCACICKPDCGVTQYNNVGTCEECETGYVCDGTNIRTCADGYHDSDNDGTCILVTESPTTSPTNAPTTSPTNAPTPTPAVPTAQNPGSAVCNPVIAAAASPDATCTVTGTPGTPCAVIDDAGASGDKFDAAAVCAGTPTAPDYIIKYDNPTLSAVPFTWESCFAETTFDITFAIYQIDGDSCEQVNCNDDRASHTAGGNFEHHTNAPNCVGSGTSGGLTSFLSHTIPAQSSLLLVVSSYTTTAASFKIELVEQ